MSSQSGPSIDVRSLERVLPDGGKALVNKRRKPSTIAKRGTFGAATTQITALWEAGQPAAGRGQRSNG
jgi:hypothetical protein